MPPRCNAVRIVSRALSSVRSNLVSLPCRSLESVIRFRRPQKVSCHGRSRYLHSGIQTGSRDRFCCTALIFQPIFFKKIQENSDSESFYHLVAFKRKKVIEDEKSVDCVYSCCCFARCCLVLYPEFFQL